MKHVGQTLKSIIEQRGLQRNHIAVKAGISPTYMSAIFHKESLDASLLERICKAIGVSPVLFFDEAATFTVTTDLGASDNPSISNGEHKALLKLLEEKERVIQILLNSKGYLRQEEQ